MRRLSVPITPTTLDSLATLALREYRGVQEQAAMLLVEGIEAAGMAGDLPPRREGGQAWDDSLTSHATGARLVIALPGDLAAALKAAADREGRTLRQQGVYELRRALLDDRAPRR